MAVAENAAPHGVVFDDREGILISHESENVRLLPDIPCAQVQLSLVVFMYPRENALVDVFHMSRLFETQQLFI